MILGLCHDMLEGMSAFFEKRLDGYKVLMMGELK